MGGYASGKRMDSAARAAALERTKEAANSYSDVQEQIEELDDSEEFANNQQRERLEFEENYFATVGRARLIIEEYTNRRVNVEVENANIGIAGENMIAASTSVRLPVMSLPTFDGTYEQWPVFYSTFSALVDKNQNLSNVHKFYYLQSALNANAKKIIESLEINEVNYPRAINLLKTCFDNFRLATRHHTRAIFSLKPIEKESSSQLYVT
ncbi:Uncharacterized protein DBV15_12841 [Temnothorax longispinosus]|uniref:Uncharacterized protein n=1 Tax=Temnothorax longispinosus TaxID=300112 RepID=A0A4S2JQG8_9HYME|nr:Uncharacterized protein DBV15_12841 [Temnothorax longispinosus]